MHRLFLLMLLAGTATAATAQQQPAMIRSQFTPYKTIPQVKLPALPMADTTAPNPLLLKAPNIKKWYYAGVLVDTNSRGRVYRMPVDKMACLVPNETQARMPVEKSRLVQRIPNAF